jgi:hypothetical protein
MNGIKLIFIAAELMMLSGIVMIAFFADWADEDGNSWMFQLLMVLMSIAAVLFQKEQQSIEWNYGDDDYVRSI